MSDVRDALARADARYARRAGYDEPLTPEHLDALAAAIRPTTDGAAAPGDDTALAEAERTVAQQHGRIGSLERERDQLAEQLQHVRAEIERRGNAAAQAAELTDALRNEVDELRAQLADAQAIATDQPHVHSYSWPAPDQPPQPCACGQPYPRTVLAEQLAKGKEVEADHEPFDALMGRIRGELSTWGNSSPAKLKGVA